MATEKKQTINIHLDVGHDTIGWAVSEGLGLSLRFTGAGTVLFQADDCLVSQRRAFRRQRRHIRATRTRIERLSAFLLANNLLTREQLAANPTSAPWKLAAQVLQGLRTLTWPELWAVLRWYAHNRGYDGNALWSGRAATEDEEDRKSNAAAHALMAEHNTTTMAETVCAIIGVNPAGKDSAGQGYFKGKKVSFDRKQVEKEARSILMNHVGHLSGLTPEMIETILANPVEEPRHLQGKALSFHLPKRYFGGLLFGQMAPRFDNRIIGRCPISKDKLPLKSTPEFLDYRWASMLANVRIGEPRRMLTPAEMQMLNDEVKKTGGFTKADFKKLIKAIDPNNNLEDLLLAPEADKSLTRFPGLYVLTKLDIHQMLPSEQLKHLAHALYRGKRFTLREIGALIPEENQWRFAELVQSKAGKGRAKKNEEQILDSVVEADIPEGRAPYSRAIMKRATEEAFSGKHPRETGGCLFRDATQADRLCESAIDTTTNNHLIRHRIRILLRLMRDIVKNYAENNPARIAGVTLELARDLKDLSGKTNKEIESELGQRTAHHKKITQILAKEFGIEPRNVSAGLIRKARIADDLGYVCPYTGKEYDLREIQSKSVDLDHILPRSQRVSDSLDSLALTFTEVNRMKGNRTALAFIREFSGEPVPGRPGLTILTEAGYLKLISTFSTKGMHDDDKKRRKRRIEKFNKLEVKDTGMADGLLTRTSHITSLARSALASWFEPSGRIPSFYNPPGLVTAKLRMQWGILGLLAKADPRILDDYGELRHKQEIRAITHMHHAVDAITLGLASAYLPQDGNVWALMCKRKLSDSEAEILRATGMFWISASGEPRLRDLSDTTRQSIIKALSEQRVVTHIPTRKGGMRVQQNPWGVVSIDNEAGTVQIRQRKRDEKTGKIEIKRNSIPIQKAFGLQPPSGTGKLKAINAILQYDTNYAVALDPEPMIIRHHKVWQQLGELKAKNNGILPRLLRRSDLIQVPQGRYQGIWRIASIKDNTKSGVMLDMAAPYCINIKTKGSNVFENVRLKTLIKDGLTILHPDYTGVPLCPTTSSTSPQPDLASSAETSN